MEKEVLIAPAGSSGCSYDGQEYPAKDGIVEVPPAAVVVLLGHGFTIPTPEQREKMAAKKEDLKKNGKKE